MVIPMVIVALGTIPKRNGKRTKRLGNQRTARYYLNDIIIKIGQNSEKSPGLLRRLVTQTPEINHQLTP